MKIAFSTLSCPNWSWSEITSAAKDLGFDGIGLRGVANEMFAIHATPFLDKNIEETKRKLMKLDLEIPCLVTGCTLFEDNDTMLDSCKKEIDLAERIGTPYIRFLGDSTPKPENEIDDSIVLKNILLLSDYAQGKKVTLLIETNGVFADSQFMADFMNKVERDNVGVLWDSHHPFRYMNESFKFTYNTLSKWIKYIQVKDSIIENGETVYKLFGQGDLNVESLIKLLVDKKYDGYISLEWVKRWNKHLEQASIALPHFKYNVSSMIAKYKKVKLPTEGLWDITIGDLLDYMALHYPKNNAIIYGDQDFRRTYKELKDECDTLAKAFLAMGIKKGSHVAIWATNYPQWILTQLATAKIGAVLVTVNTNYKIFEAEYLLRQSDSETLILMEGFKDTNYVEITRELCPELDSCEKGRLESLRLPKLKNIIYLDDKQYNGVYNWDELYSMSDDISDAQLSAVQNSLDSHDAINIQYTSGTTGFPKGVMLTHYNIVNNGKNIGDCMNLTPEDRLCIPVPFFHCFGCVLGILASITHATCMVPLDHYNPIKVMNAVSTYKCTALHGVPTMFINILDNKDFSNYDYSYLRTGIMAGSPCPEKVMLEVIEKMNMKEITIAYGQTEAAPVCTQTKVDDDVNRRVSTVGMHLPYVECKVVDPETNEEAPCNVQGEFVARGYNIMKGYYKMPEATAQAIDEDGWLHTGDLATMDEYGYFKITGRIKDMIIRGGENIYPKEIEEFLYTQEGILDVQVAGIPDKQYGEEVGAFIKLKAGTCMTEDDIRDKVRENMARHKVPRYVFFVDSFPMTASGKIQKYKLREIAGDMIGLDQTDLDATV